MISPLGWIVIWIGVLFDVLGTVGLIRFPDVYNRLQASTKCVTLGTFGIMVGIFLLKGLSPMGIKALIGAGFLLLTNPVAAHALMRGSLHFGRKMWKGTVIDKYGEEKLGSAQIEKEEN